MIISTTHTIAGYKIERYLGLINANQVLGVNLISDFIASFSDVFGGRSGTYRERLDNLYNDIMNLLEQKAMSLGANAILGVHLDFDEISGKEKSMFMVTAYGNIDEAINEFSTYAVCDKEIARQVIDLI